MKIIKKAIGKAYRVTCYECGSMLEADKEDIKAKGPFTIVLCCPVCECDRSFDRDTEVEEIIIYEGEEDS